MKKPYKEFKNHLHNTLGISKKDVEDWTKEEIKNLVEPKIENLFQDSNFRELIGVLVANQCKGEIRNHLYDRISFQDYFKDVVSSEVKHQIKNKINFKINVENET